MGLQSRQIDLQERELALRERATARELELRARAQEGELELRRLAIQKADENEKAANGRLANADRENTDFAKRGQTYAMWLAGISTGVLLAGGLVCVFLAVAGVIAMALGLAAGGLLLAGGLFAGIANLIKNFLPRD